jgi:hypothetical protein
MLITGTGGTDGLTWEGLHSMSEVVTLTCLVFAGALIWTDVLAAFCDVATNGDATHIAFQQSLNDLNAFMKQRYLPLPMREALREFFLHTRHLLDAESSTARQGAHRQCPPSHAMACPVPGALPPTPWRAQCPVPSLPRHGVPRARCPPSHAMACPVPSALPPTPWRAQCPLTAWHTVMACRHHAAP